MNRALLLCILLFTSAPLAAQELTGSDIVRRMTEVANPDQARGIFALTITTSGGQERTFLYESFSKNRGEKNLMRYLEPSRVKGQATLMLNNADDIWVYFPRTNRVRKLATHAKKQKMESSDFAYEDLGSGESFIENFDHRRLEDVRHEGKDCYQVELTVKPGKESSYSRLVMLVDKSNFLFLSADYYDEKDPGLLNKRLTVSKIKEIQGIPTPMRMVMRSLDDNTESIMEIREIDYQVDLPDEMFSERGLRQ